MKTLAPLAALALLGGCAFTVPIRPSIEGSRWQVTRINGGQVPATPQYQVEFRDGRFGGRLGCNSFGGPFSLGAETLMVGPVAATKMACAGRGMADEAAGFAIIGQPMRMVWTDLGARLILTSPAGSLDLRRIS